MIDIAPPNKHLLLVSSAAWVLLVIWQWSPLSAFLDHGDWTRLGLLAAICSVNIPDNPLASIPLFAAGWVLMVIAMMLPTTAALFVSQADWHFEADHRVRIFCLKLFGYLIPWLVFGVFAHGLGYLLNKLVKLSMWWSLNGWVVGCALFALAGLYQFTGLKNYHLGRCCEVPMKCGLGTSQKCTPPFHNAVLPGLKYGTHCVICCGPLMLLMFLFWPGSILWMLTLSALMIADRMIKQQKTLQNPIGLMMICAALGIAAHHSL